jgi:hypothetical protein
MSPTTLRNTAREDLGETWYRHQVARIVQRHLQFGRHCRLDVDALVNGIARMIRRATPDIAACDCLRQLDIGGSRESAVIADREAVGVDTSAV